MRMFVRIPFILSFLVASSAFALDAGDRNAIHGIVGHSTSAWNEREGRGFADYYTEDADFVNIFGMAFSGKKEIERRHIRILETFMKGTHFEVTDLKVREVKPGIAMVHVYWTVSGIQKPGIQDKEVMKGVFTHAFIKNNNAWEITATQNTMIRE